MIRVEISNIQHSLIEKSMTISHRISERSYATFMIKTELTTFIKKSSPIQIFNDTELLFSGTVDTVRDKARGGKRFHEIACVDNHYFVDKRVFVKAFTQVNTGDIVKSLVDTVLTEEGITYTTDSIQTGVATSIPFNYDYCDTVMDKLSERSGYVWWVDHNKVLYFQDPTSITNPNTIINDHIKYGTLEVESDRHLFRDVQYVKGARDLTEIKYDLVTYDGTSSNFPLRLPIGELIDVKIGGSFVAETEIGKKNEENDADKPILWAFGDPIVAMDTSSLTNGNLIEFTYRGLIPIIGLSVNQRQIEELQTLEGGSGKVENVATEPELIGALSAIQSANAKNQKYGSLDQMSIRLTTLESGYDVGELVHVTLENESIDEDFLIEEVKIFDELNFAWYDLKLVRGSIYESWAKVFQKALEKNDTANSDELKLEETLVIAKDYSKTWLESENPNPFNVWYPSETTYPSETLFPGFEENQRVTRVVIDYIWVVTGTPSDKWISRSNVYDVGGDLLTVFYVNPNEVNGTWTQLRFYGGVNQDILLDTVSVNIEKNEQEAIQIQRKEIKGW